MKALPRGPYNVVLADPPWDYYGAPDKWGAARKFYSTMTTEELATLPLGDRLTDPAVVFLWATGPKLDQAIELLGAWGLHYRGVAFVWVKTTKDGVPLKAQGVRPSIVKPITEFVLVGSTQAKGRPMQLASEAIVQTVFAPKGEHSTKPEQVQDRIEEMYPEATRLELFARRKRKGWKCWGDEI